MKLNNISENSILIKLLLNYFQNSPITQNTMMYQLKSHKEAKAHQCSNHSSISVNLRAPALKAFNYKPFQNL